MKYDSIEKGNYSWHDISIMPNQQKDGVDIFLLFKDMNDGAALYKHMIESNPAPSFICTCLDDGTHTLKIDYSPDDTHEEFIQAPCSYTLETYPPLGWLKKNQKYRIIIGTKHQGQIMGSALVFVPLKVEYIEAPKPSSSNLN